MTRRGGVVTAVVAIAGAAAATLAATSAGREDPGPSAPRPRPTAQISRRDLVARDSFAGTLGYADSRPVRSGTTGTITWLAREGSVVRRGERLFRIDAGPVRLLYGDVPAWRSMTSGTEGADVLQLERNLAALGYTDGGDMDVDGDFDDDTAQAVEDWEEDIGGDEDGAVDLDEAVFLPGARRVGSHELSIGDGASPGSEVLSTTSREQAVTVQLEASRQALARRGARVEVELPNGETVPGGITDVGAVAELDPEDEDAEPTVEVTIAVDAPGLNLDQAPVDVNLATEVARDVLAVPVEALLALAEGGYAVEVQEGGRTRLVAVETGLFADGWVEVAGDIEEGMEVVVAE